MKQPGIELNNMAFCKKKKIDSFFSVLFGEKSLINMSVYNLHINIISFQCLKYEITKDQKQVTVNHLKLIISSEKARLCTLLFGVFLHRQLHNHSKRL